MSAVDTSTPGGSEPFAEQGPSLNDLPLRATSNRTARVIASQSGERHETPESVARGDATLAEELGLLIDGATTYAIYMLDPQGRVTIWNRGAERIKGWAEAEIIGRDFAIFYPADDIAAGRPHADLARAHACGRIEEESWRVRKDGSEFLAHVTITALHDDAGALRGFGKVIRDITQDKAAEAAIVRREHHLRSILNTVPDAMIVMNENGIVSSFSAAAELVFGYAASDVIGQNVAVVEPEALSLAITALVEVRLRDERAATVDAAKALFRATPEVQQCYYVTGGISFVMVIICRDMRSYEALTRSLFAENELVDYYRTNIALDRVKAGTALAVA